MEELEELEGQIALLTIVLLDMINQRRLEVGAGQMNLEQFKKVMLTIRDVANADGPYNGLHH